MNRFLMGLLLVSFLVSAEPEKKEIEVGRYQVVTTTYTSPKTGKLYILETTYDTKTGKVTKRKRFYHANYGKKRR